MDLSSYIDFTVALDFTNNTVKLIDTGAYPSGVPAGITGVISVKQPDGITVVGNWTTPDVYFSGSSLVNATKHLRRAGNSKPQKGTYVVTYTVRHTGYTDTVKQKSFYLDYSQPKIIITKDFDVFTPELSLIDETNYVLPLMTVLSLTRSWSVQVGSLGSITGSSSTIDLKFGGSYYDAKYIAALNIDVTYNLNAYNFVNIIDFISEGYVAYANTPVPYVELRDKLNQIKNWSITACKSGNCKELDAYDKAFTLYFHIKETICNDEAQEAYDYITQFLEVYYEKVATYINTDAILSGYDRSFCLAVGQSGSNWIRYKSSDFTPGTTYLSKPEIAGKLVAVFSNDLPRFLKDQLAFPPGEYAYVPTGLQINLPGFNPDINEYEIYVWIKGDIATSPVPVNLYTSEKYPFITANPTILWTAERIARHGAVGSFEVWGKNVDNTYTLIDTQPIPDNGDTPTQYLVDTGGYSAGYIRID